jgi:site-specific recombinase XerC
MARGAAPRIATHLLEAGQDIRTVQEFLDTPTSARR